MGMTTGIPEGADLTGNVIKQPEAGGVPDFSSDFFQNIHETLINVLGRALSGKLAEYSGIAYQLGKYGITIYVLWYAFTVVMGKQKSPVHDFIWNLSRFWIIILFVKNIDGFLSAAIDAIDGMKITLAGGDPWLWMDQLWVKTLQVSTIIYGNDKDTIALAGGIGALFTYIGGLLAMLACGMVFLMAEVTIKALTVTAPLFIMLVAFGFLRQMFNGWFGLIFNALLVYLFGGLAVSAGMSVLNTTLSVALVTTTKQNLIATGATACAAGIFMAFMLWMAKHYASQIAGVGVQGALEGAAAMGLGAATFGGSKLLGAGLKSSRNFTGGAWRGVRRQEGGLSQSQGVAGKLGNLAGQGTNMAYKRGKAAVEAARKKYGN
ncbi:type IV secretion system protein [Escherichia albertii]|nr:type IV secretion system protein [Escherichia albertii]